jgi:membrane associated rhomboid family serine protease
MQPASVGFQCPECVREGARSTRQGRTAYGGVRPGSPGTVTLALIALNAFVFILVRVTGGADSAVLARLSLIPKGATYLVNGRPTFVEGVADGAYYQLVTSMFTHVEFWHIGFNMVALYVLGPQLELMLGRARYLGLYLLSGLVGSATVYWLASPSSITVGASGALFGLMAALLIVAVRVRADVQSLLVLVGVNVLITVLGRGFISWEGHLGGFVGGMVLGAILVYSPRNRRTLWQAVGFSVVLAVTLAVIVLRTLALT